MSSHDFPMEQTTSTGSMTRSNSMVVSPTTTTSPPTGMQRRSSLPAATVKRAGRDERFTQTDIRDLIWGVEWEADPALRRSKESILPLDTDIIVAPHHSTSQSYSTMAMQRRTSDDDDDGEGTTGPSGPPSQKVIGLPSTDECIFLRAAHHRVRQFMSLIQVWLEDPKKLDFVGEWVGQQHPSRVGEHFRQQAEDEDTLLAALKEELKHVMRSSEVSAEEKIERCRVFADRQKMIFLKRAERQKESALLLAEHHRSTFIRINTLTIEGDEEEHDASFVGAEELANSIVAHLGKFFVFLQSAVEQTQVIPSGAELLSLQLFPGGVRQKTVYGLQSGLHNELDAVLMPRDFEELKLIVKGNELPDLYKLKYTEKWDFGADELEYLREKFLKQYAAEELQKIQQTSKKKKDETMSALNKELGKMRASATQQIKELEDSVNTAAAITARQQRSRQNSSAPSSAGGAHSVIPPSPRPSGSLVTSGEVSPVTPSLSPAPLQTQLTRPGSSGIGKPPISPAVPFMAGGSVSNVEWFPVIPATPQPIHVDENAATLAFQALTLAAGERPGSASGSALSTGRGGGGNEASTNSEASECLKAAVGAAISPRDAPLVAAATKPPASSKLPHHQDTHGSSGPHHALARQKSSLVKQPSGAPPSAILAPGASSNGPSSESPSQAALTGWVDQQQIMSNNGNLLGSTVAAEVRDGDGSTRGQGRDLAVIGSVSSFRRPLQREASSVKNVATKIKSALHLRNGASTAGTSSQEKSTSHQRDSSSSDPFAVPTSQPQLSGAPASHTITAVPNTSAVSELTTDTKTAAAAASLAHAREQLTAVVDTLMTTQPSRSRRHLTSSLRGTVASAPTSLLGLGDTSLAADLQLQQLQQQNASDTRPQKKLYVANAKSSDTEGGRVDYVVSPARRGSSPSSPLNRQIEAAAQ
ncbi:Hypothetical protein, putative [Bodo saltans]|uniref:Uncharacterized protein n=1 Tax=Bodo saltans TaxID=75058 RepID=A0A0S4JMD0_BODSA|nr:Hypothetical protein, putative [Bodo saltans]|eukprot:CUG91385.1 Hypothetical protein, putative [Bodo saltans]